ncbi:protein AF-10 [Phlebotomus argentipes]|uniref:protein AF-10 n=1 Tax=Phlebotomus argentipes TaxID=94469 RepID=UPI0028933048|nr:protein AF-10 [Phlebotomus argentipes]
MKEMVGGCCVCSDERGWPENPLVYCDGLHCNVAVHQACYGIVTVPTGPWYCRKCESQERSARVRCELCPSRDGALKKTDNASWAHVVCALYIPEVRFGNVTTMEPIILQLIPAERYAKNCYICEEMGKVSRATMGACMQCNRTGCRMQFHVTCAQTLGLLCEEAGNYLDNVKYCGYCQHHYSKLKKGGNVKPIPPYKPVTHEAGSSDSPSSPEKDGEATTAAAAAAAAAAQSGAAQPSTTAISASALPAAAAATKQRKSSSSAKAVATSGAAAGAVTPGGAAATPQMASALSSASATSVASRSISAAPVAGKMGSSAAGGVKDKDKHSRGAGKASAAKEKDFRDKTKASSKKDDASVAAKAAPAGVLAAAAGVTTTKASSIIAPSILQSSKELLKDAGKFTTSNFTESVVVNSESVFGGEGGGGKGGPASTAAAKKRKADAKANSVDDANNGAPFCRDLIKDVSVTLIPLSSVDKLDLSEVKKMRTESAATSSPAEGAALLTSSTTTLAMAKQLGGGQPLLAATSIIKPPVIKDVGDLGRVQSAASPFAAELQASTTTQSIRVSVPLSTASVAGVSLPTNNNSTATLMSPSMPSTSTAGSLFQQAIHNRSAEQLGGFAMGRLAAAQPPQQRASPIVQVPATHQNVILQTMERQSPLVQAAAASPLMAHAPALEQAVPPASAAAAMQNLSPHVHSQILATSGVAAVHQSDSGMLKITYEKQPQPRATPTPAQDDSAASGRRSSKSRSAKRRPAARASSAAGGESCGSFSSTESPFSVTNSHTPAGGQNHGGDFASSFEAKVRPRGPMDTPPPHSTARTPDTSSFGATSFGGLKFSYESQPGSSAPAPKDSPPSSPGSEAGGARKRNRKSGQAEAKELKIFQNGIHVTHMLGNQLNPASSVAQKMSDQLHMEIEAHSVYTAPAMDTSPQLVGPPFPGKPAVKAAAAQQGPPSLTTMLGAGSGSSSGSGTTPQSLEQLLERQWEQGSQFLMEQAQHFDIASLLSCLHQLQTENVRLEEHVNNLVARRDHLLAVNARLAIPLANPNAPSSQVQFNSMAVNGPTDAAVVTPGRTSRSSAAGQTFGVQPASQQAPAPSQAPLQQIPVENGVDFRHAAVSAVTITPHQPPSGGSVRHSPVTQPFVGQAAAGVRQASGGGGQEASRARCAGGQAGTGVFQTQQTTSSYQVSARGAARTGGCNSAEETCLVAAADDPARRRPGEAQLKASRRRGAAAAARGGQAAAAGGGAADGKHHWRGGVAARGGQDVRRDARERAAPGAPLGAQQQQQRDAGRRAACGGGGQKFAHKLIISCPSRAAASAKAQAETQIFGADRAVSRGAAMRGHRWVRS